MVLVLVLVFNFIVFMEFVENRLQSSGFVFDIKMGALNDMNIEYYLHVYNTRPSVNPHHVRFL